MDQIQGKIKLNGWFEKLEVWHGNQGKRKKEKKKKIIDSNMPPTHG
jgi:hypothetical protein